MDTFSISNHKRTPIVSGWILALLLLNLTGVACQPGPGGNCSLD
jgi:hypothetical protein